MRAYGWCLAAAAMALGCNDMTEKAALPASDVKADLTELAGARVYFGHQSVGGNVLDGLAKLSAENGVALRIVDASAGPGDAQPGLFHAKVGKNREPATKCDAFGRFLGEAPEVRWDAAMLKFCYADMGDRTDIQPALLLDLYKRMVATVRAARPDLVLVHATVPLNANGLGKGDRVKGFLGLGTSKDASNVRRNRFNDLLRAEYQGEPLFDVARAESTRPDGTRTGFKKDGQLFFAMARELTSDGGHLNPEGQRWIAREFARSLADALRGRQAVAEAPREGSGP